jgi:hypothetical protein
LWPEFFLLNVQNRLKTPYFWWGGVGRITVAVCFLPPPHR